MGNAELTLLVLAFIAFFFVTEMIPLAMTAILGAIAVGILGIIPVGQVFSGLSNSNVTLFGGMFVIGAAMFHTGLAQNIGRKVVSIMGTSENSLMISNMSIAAALSSVLSNTGTTACLMPVTMGICKAAKISVKRQLMPLAFGAGLGGTITLVGTPPNVIAANALKAAGLTPFGFFEFAWIGIPLTVVGILYMVLFGKRFLPKNDDGLAGASMDADAAEEATAKTHDMSKQWITGLTLLVVVAVMALGIKWLPLEVAAALGAVFLVLTKCISEKDAYRGIDWVTIFLLAGMMPVATALDKSGAGKLITNAVVGLMGGTPGPMTVMIVLFLLSVGLTQFMSNTAATALLAPIGIGIAKGLGASPQAVLMAICIAASCAFATPVGTPPNTLVLGPGGYRFMDYVKAGFGLIVVSMIVCVTLIPMIWPFFPGK